MTGAGAGLIARKTNLWSEGDAAVIFMADGMALKSDRGFPSPCGR